MDYNTKAAIWSLNAMNLLHQQCFLLELIFIFVGMNKLLANMGDHLWYWTQLKLVRLTHHSLGTLGSKKIDLVDWEMVHNLLC